MLPDRVLFVARTSENLMVPSCGVIVLSLSQGPVSLLRDAGWTVSLSCLANYLLRLSFKWCCAAGDGSVDIRSRRESEREAAIRPFEFAYPRQQESGSTERCFSFLLALRVLGGDKDPPTTFTHTVSFSYPRADCGSKNTRGLRDIDHVSMSPIAHALVIPFRHVD